ncbi:MAG: septation protein SepH [Actinomycetota bacterium]
MVRLHLVGFTTDLQNLIFATRRGAKRGGYILTIDNRLLGTLEEVSRMEVEEESPFDELAAPPQPEVAPVPVSVLSPKQIQTLLREGKSEEQVAKMAETDVSWIHRFTSPILAERAGVIDSVKAGMVTKARLGPSMVPVGQAIQQNLADKRVKMEPGSYENAWKAVRRSGRWHVSFQFASRGKRKLARYLYDPESGAVEAANEVGQNLGWRPNNSRRGKRLLAAGGGTAKPSSKPKAKPKAKPKPKSKPKAKPKSKSTLKSKTGPARSSARSGRRP